MRVRKPISLTDSIGKDLHKILVKEKLVWSHPERVSGDLLIYDTRVPLSLFLQFLSENKIEEFEEAYPSVSKDKIIGILSHLAKTSLKKRKAKVRR
ncbi:MAG TPA: hypothetical protein VL728_14100 [Cyclobacteriaceae bacterium]|jgi:uncharacterized protein (DUF433 family)|nr:hypothetical protein [Cyclobacteriaceae bacterium]